MNTTSISKKLEIKFGKQLHNNHTSLNNISIKIIKQIYSSFYDINQHIQYVLPFEIKKIISKNDIPLPVVFNINDIIKPIRDNIMNYSKCYIKYSLNILDKNITIFFVCQHSSSISNIEKYNIYVRHMMIWLYYAIYNASISKCSKDLNIIIYETTLKKTLPSLQNQTLNVINANTAFTSTCQSKSEILIYRTEEWFKVFIHETFHNFGLDFSNNNTFNDHITKEIQKKYYITANVLLFETYCETWARIINVIMIVFSNGYKKWTNNERKIISTNLKLETLFSVNQMNKVLKYLHLTIRDFVKPSGNIAYSEKTNIFAYYVMTAGLMVHHDLFMKWCYDNSQNNQKFIQFNTTLQNIINFNNFVYDMTINNETITMSDKSSKFNDIDKNMRMSLFEH